MTAAGLARSCLEEGRAVYEARVDHPFADVLRVMLQGHQAETEGPDIRNEEALGKLAGLGLPLSVAPRSVAADEDTESLVAAGARATHDDPTALRAFPALLWRLRDRLDFDRLERTARRLKVAHTLGFLLALTAELGDDERLRERAEAFRDRRRKRPQAYIRQESELSRQLAEARTPAVADRWGWRMNIGQDAFVTAFEKFRPNDLPG